MWKGENELAVCDNLGGLGADFCVAGIFHQREKECVSERVRPRILAEAPNAVQTRQFMWRVGRDLCQDIAAVRAAPRKFELRLKTHAQVSVRQKSAEFIWRALGHALGDEGAGLGDDWFLRTLFFEDAE